MPAGSVVTMQRLGRIEDLERLAPEWWGLWEKDPRATPFQSPAWLIPWWRCLGEGELCCLSVRHSPGGGDTANGALVGLWPVYLGIEPTTLRKKLLPVGLGISDYLDGLFAPGWEEICLGAFFQSLQRQMPPGVEVEMRPLREGSPLLSVSPPAGWRSEVEECGAAVGLALPEGTRHLYEVLPPRLSQKLKYYQNRAQREGEVRFETVTEEKVGEWWKELLRLHEARWSRRGQSGVLADPRVRQVHEQALPGLFSGGLLRMVALRFNQRLAAIFYGFGDTRPGRERVYYYLGGFDPDLERFSPGTLVIGYALEEALRAGARQFDFLRGQENYKYSWGGVDQLLFHRRFRWVHDPGWADT